MFSMHDWKIVNNSHLNFGKEALVLYLTYRKLLNKINLWEKPTIIQPFFIRVGKVRGSYPQS